MNCLS